MSDTLHPDDLIRAPLGTCPFCGSLDAFGTFLSVGGGRVYTKKCRKCRRLKRIPLPPLTRKIIYLDQFVISNIVKALDPSTTPQKRARLGSFWRDAFEKIHRLCKLQLIVCPDSPIHYDESVVTTDFRKLKRIYELLSSGSTFHEPERIRNVQIISLARKWIISEAHFWNFTPQEITNGRLDEWGGHLQLTLNPGMIPGLIDELREARTKKNEGFASVHEMWKNDQGRGFWDWFREERLGLGKVLMKEVTETLKRQILIRTGKLQPRMEDMLPTLNWRLFQTLHEVFAGAGLSQELAMRKVWEFLNSEELGKVPFVRISCLMFGAMAQLANRGKKTRPKHPFNDVDVVAAYLPYCSAVFVDKEIDVILREPPLPSELSEYHTQVFSLRSKEVFFDYLDQIEQNATPEHMALVRDVYGECSEKPFVEVFGK